MASSDLSLPEEDDLLQACRAALQSRTEFEALDASIAFTELVSNKMLIMYYQRSDTMTPFTRQALDHYIIAL